MKRFMSSIAAVLCLVASVTCDGGLSDYLCFTNQSGKNSRLFDTYSMQKPDTPDTVGAVQDLVKKACAKKRKISLVGAGKSMGGQTVCDASCAYQISLEKLHHLIQINVAQKEVTVQAGMTWRQLQEHIVPHGLAVKAMQSYNDFSIGGSLSVNVHGQDRTTGQIIKTVKSFRLVNAQGKLLTVSREQNAELFGLAIGGYGLFGIIVEVTLQLTDDVLLKRYTKSVKTSELSNYFRQNIKNSPSVEFYSARFHLGSSDLLEKAYVITYERAGDKKVGDDYFSLLPSEKNYLYRNMLWMVKTFPSLKNIRPTLAKYYFRHLYPNEYISRNNFMNSSIEGLPQNTLISHYILQEYFIPYDHLTSFIDGLKGLIKEYGINVLNLSARHVHADNESQLSFAPQEACALVLYICVPKKKTAYDNTVSWTRKVIDRAIACKGTFYLPYQLLAKREQLERAYPTWKTFTAQKNKYDPQGVFRNKLFEAYT